MLSSGLLIHPALAWLSLVLVAFFGACFGSFAALVIYRLPQGYSIVWPRSYCGFCKKQLFIWHNIPIISWLILRGKCFFCRKPFGSRPLFIEVILSMTLLALYLKFGLGIAMADRFCFIFLLICLAYIDLDTFYLPLSLLFFLIFLGLLLNVLYAAYPDLYTPLGSQIGILKLMVFSRRPEYNLVDKVLGGIGGALFMSAVNLFGTFALRRTGRLRKDQWAMGWGDPLLVFAIGLFVGLSHLVLVVFLASALGSLLGLIGPFLKAPSQNDSDIASGALPYGPFLALAAIYVYIV